MGFWLPPLLLLGYSGVVCVRVLCCDLREPSNRGRISEMNQSMASLVRANPTSYSESVLKHTRSQGPSGIRALYSAEARLGRKDQRHTTYTHVQGRRINVFTPTLTFTRELGGRSPYTHCQLRASRLSY